MAQLEIAGESAAGLLVERARRAGHERPRGRRGRARGRRPAAGWSPALELRHRAGGGRRPRRAGRRAAPARRDPADRRRAAPAGLGRSCPARSPTPTGRCCRRSRAPLGAACERLPARPDDAEAIGAAARRGGGRERPRARDRGLLARPGRPHGGGARAPRRAGRARRRAAACTPGRARRGGGDAGDRHPGLSRRRRDGLRALRAAAARAAARRAARGRAADPRAPDRRGARQARGRGLRAARPERGRRPAERHAPEPQGRSAARPRGRARAAAARGSRTASCRPAARSTRASCGPGPALRGRTPRYDPGEWPSRHRIRGSRGCRTLSPSRDWRSCRSSGGCSWPRTMGTRHSPSRSSAWPR